MSRFTHHKQNAVGYTLLTRVGVMLFVVLYVSMRRSFQGPSLALQLAGPLSIV